jgi:hypothetical protein
MLARVLRLIVAALSLAACASGYGERLDSGLVQSMKLERIDVSVAPDATFTWADGERAYARSIGKPEQEAEALATTADGRAFMQSLASQRIRAAFERELGGRLSGKRPVRLVVIMHDVNVASAIQRIVIGGHYRMKATANLVDARSGEIIAGNPNVSVTALAGQGIGGALMDPAFGEPIDRLASSLAGSYRNWLLQS